MRTCRFSFSYRFFLLLFLPCAIHAQQGQRPKIGLTLSGGGAKGLAHIGILKAIDSAGLQVDYVTGTSMGAIVGSLYAQGYTGDTILKISKKLDWNILLSNKSSLNAFIMEEKNEYGRYALELPMQSGRFSIPSGVLEAEELWLKFDELYFPVYGIRQFDQLKRPFKCIATNLATGEAVVLEKGDLISAVRASMAIPSVFTAVMVDGKKLVDGGLVRNFPASDLKKMGADIIIGSNVSSGLLTSEKLTSPVQILMQIAFYKEAETTQKEKELCNVYISHPLEKYTAASFGSSDSIMAMGVEMGKLYYPYFKKMADSLNAIYGSPAPVASPAIAKEVTIRHIIADSLRLISQSFLRRMLGIKEGKSYTVKQLEDGIRQAYGTRYFNRLYYQLEPVSPGVADMRLIAEENAPIIAKLGINYNSFSNIMLIANISIRDLVGKPSISSATVGLSENPRVRLEHTMIFGTKKIPMASVSELYAERQEFSQYRSFKTVGNYRQSNLFFDTRLQLAFRRRQLYAVGLHWENVNLKPLSETVLDVQGKNNYFQGYFRYEYNSQDRLFLPRRGSYFLLEPSVLVSNPKDIIFKSNGTRIFNLDSVGLNTGSFMRLRMQVQKVVPLRGRHYITLQGEAAANLNTSQLIFHDFVLGGLQPMMRNQVSFMGIADASVRTNSLVKGSINWRYQFSGSVYAAVTANLMYHSFLREEFYAYPSKLLSGYGLTLGIDSPIGPLEFSFMYSDQSKILKNYVNLGFRFSRAMF
jgi:NTE family protein